MMFKSMGWDYVFELWSPTGLLFIPQVIHEHRETWLDELYRKILLICPPELSGNPTSEVIW
jgi:hypothetical protein